MSGGAGHTRDMTNRLKQNRELLTSKRERYAKYEGRYAKHDTPDKLYRKEIPHPKLKIFKKHIRARARKENQETLAISIVVTALIVLVLLGLYSL